MTRKELAEMIGASKEFTNDMVNGKGTNIKNNLLREIHKVTRIDYDELIEWNWKESRAREREREE